jgi:hypothetical protein
MSNELRPIGPGRYAFTLNTPWGQAIPAEVIVATVAGWSEHPEARDGRWTAYRLGPIVLALRLLGGLTGPPPPSGVTKAARPPRPAALPRSPVPAEWN